VPTQVLSFYTFPALPGYYYLPQLEKESQPLLEKMSISTYFHAFGLLYMSVKVLNRAITGTGKVPGKLFLMDGFPTE
jgi:hypothetical protein